MIKLRGDPRSRWNFNVRPVEGGMLEDGFEEAVIGGYEGRRVLEDADR